MKPSLDGPRAKVKRADNQIVSLHQTLQRFFERNPYRVVVAEFDRKAGHHALRVESGPLTLPDEWGVLIGEIAHDLRSALDGVVWQLARLTCANPLDHTAFPICRVGHGKRKRKGSARFHRQFRGGGSDLLQSVNRRYWARIEALQPYKRGNGGRLSPLFLLQELNNTDKHRLTTVVTVVAGGINLQGFWGHPGKIKVGVPLHLNAKIGTVAPLPPNGVRVLDIVNGQVVSKGGKLRTRVEHEVQVNATITPGIRFGDTCDAVSGLPVIRTLQRITDEVTRIMESFTPEFA